MDRRIKLQNELEQEFGDFVAEMPDGSPAIFFQPPENIKLRYPCIIYELSAMNNLNANDKRYIGWKEYDFVIIDTDPDSKISEKMLDHFSKCRYIRRYMADNLVHDVVGLFY